MEAKYINGFIDSKSINREERSFIAIASTETPDRDGEVIEVKGWDLKNYQKNPVVLLAHDYSQLPIGKALWTKKTKEGLKFKPQFADTALGQEVFDLYAGGFMKAFSVGFKPISHVRGDGVKEPRITYTKTELLEISAVSVPANSEALILAADEGRIKTKALLDVVHALQPSGNDSVTDMDDEADEQEEITKEADTTEEDFDSIESDTVTIPADEYNDMQTSIKELNECIEVLEAREPEQKTVIVPHLHIKTPIIDVDAMLQRKLDRMSGRIS